MISTYGYDSVDGEDCTNTWYDFTGESYSWGSANTSIATLANPQTHFVGVGSTSGYAHVQLEGMHVPCNTTVFQPQSPQNTRPKVTIQVQSGFLSSMSGNGLVLLVGTGGLGSTAISAGGYSWSAGPRLQISGANSANASVSATGPSTSAGDTYVSNNYTLNGQTDWSAPVYSTSHKY